MVTSRQGELTETPHDLVDFMRQNGAALESEYNRIRKRSNDDPGTAGDEGEENWAELLRNWLPSNYTVVTKGRILTSRGKASPQVDVLVLRPGYPKALINKKMYMSVGLLAAFECKNTLRRDGLEKAARNSKAIAEILEEDVAMAKGHRRRLEHRDPVYDALHKPFVYGLLAHSHNWSEATVGETINSAIWELDESLVEHPREMLDLVCVADVAVWSAGRMAAYLELDDLKHGLLRTCVTTYTHQHRDSYGNDLYVEHYTVLGALIARLYTKLAQLDGSAAQFSNYFSSALYDGNSGGPMRHWGDLLPPEVRHQVDHRFENILNLSFW